jgi:hypothetical protein
MNQDFSIGKFAEAPLLGEAALQEAFAELRGAHADSSANGRQPGARYTQPHGEPPSKTVAQVLGEIAWLMTQSPRHKAVPLGDLEWLVMPTLLLRQFRIFYKGEQPVGVALGRWPMSWWPSGSMPATGGWLRRNGRAGATCASSISSRRLAAKRRSGGN